MLTWLCAAFEVWSYLALKYAPAIAICPASSEPYSTNIAFSGGMLVVLGAAIRALCVRELGALFTYELSIRTKHKLITTGPYSIVRHPSYAAACLIITGLPLTHLTRGSWLTECAFRSHPSIPTGIWIAWWVWAVAAGTGRAVTEDGELKKQFGGEWDVYAARVGKWFFPGVI